MPVRFDSRDLRPDAFLSIDTYCDSFACCAQVRSELLYGDATMSKTPWLSVVIPTYNRDALLEAALKSVLAQRDVPWPFEILVVDNTPFDAQGQTPALQLIRRLDDERILYYHNAENIGIGYNWNRCVELACGEWICFLHDDDLLCPDALQHVGAQIQNYRGEKPLGYIHARRTDFTADFHADSEKRYPQEKLTRFGVLISGCTGAGSPTCGTAILKEAYIACGGINYGFASSADAVLCYQIMRDYAVVTSTHILGGSRWDANESLRRDTLLQMIRADELLSDYTYAQTLFSRWWGRRFGDASTWRNIHRKRKIADAHGISIAKSEFRTVTKYDEPGIGKKGFFLFHYAVYRAFRYLCGMICP